MPDIFSYETVEALRLSGCALCRALAIEDQRWVDTFAREGRRDPGTRRRFLKAGGFCRHHAWLLHRSVAGKDKGTAIADVYGWLAENDLDRLDEFRRGLGRTRRRQRSLERSTPCPACVFLAEATGRKVEFFVEVLPEARVRREYASSEGLCFTHLVAVVERALEVDEEAAGFLLDDWRTRLAHVRMQLAEFDRKRDYRYAAEPKGDEQSAWTEVIRRYVGEDFTDPSS